MVDVLLLLVLVVVMGMAGREDTVLVKIGRVRSDLRSIVVVSCGR